MATFWEIAARSVSNLFSLYFVYLKYLFISRFGFKSGICLLIVPVPFHCFSITLRYVPFQCYCQEKWRQSGTLYFYMSILLRKLFIWLKQIKHWRESIALLATYKPYTQFSETFYPFSRLFGCYGYNFSDTYRKLNPKLAKERADNSK